MNVYLEIDDALKESLRLWRYMDLAKLISLLETEEIWLARADTFKDRHEGRFPDEMRRWTEKAYESFSADDPSPVKDADDFQDYLLKNTFVSCWHKNIDENMVMWEIYGRDTNAIAVQTTVGRINDSIDSSRLSGHSLLLKPVVYEKSEDVQGVLNYEECFFRKRPHFAFEEEVRISLDTYSRTNPTKGTPYGYGLPALINVLVESIYVHPDSSDWFVDVVNSITKRYAVHAEVKRGLFGNK
ncbi:MAG: hypothetical protein NT179_06460 [Nitrospirae bacterium]|nr:hypothetical protein [Nitrospirota bacterium]